MPAFLSGAPVNPRSTGTPFLRIFLSDDYGGAPVNWTVLQHPRSGFLYVGNNFGVLEYDGAAWRLIPLPSEGPVRTLAINAGGEVWIGGYDEVCLLRPDAHGELRAANVTSRLPPTSRIFGQVLLSLATPHGIYFASANRLLLFRPDGTADAWPAPGRINGLWWQHGSLYASLDSAGVAALADQRFEIVAAPPASPDPLAPAALRVLASRDEPDGGALLLTARGPMRWRGPGTPFEPLSPETSALFARTTATAANFVQGGQLAFGFLNEGLALLDTSGQLRSRLDRNDGLSSNRIESLAPDTEGGLWIAQRTGLARLQVDDRFAIHGAPQGLTGSPRALERLGDRLYIAHNEGAAWRDDATGRMHPLTGLQAGLNTFLRIGNRLFATGTSFFEVMPDDTVRRVLPTVLTSLEPLPALPGYYLGGNTSELWLLRFEDPAWRAVGRVAGVTEGISAIHADASGSAWCTPYSGRGAWRVDFGGTADTAARVRFYGDAAGLPPVRRRDELRFTRLGGELYATTGQWIRRYDATADRFVAVPGQERGPIAAARVNDGTEWWFLGSPGTQLAQVLPGAGGGITLESLPAASLQGLIPNSIYHDEATRTLWLAGQGALISADLAWRPLTPPAPLRVVIRRVASATGETLFADTGVGRLVPDIPVLSSRHDALRFTFAAPTLLTDYRGRTSTLYRTRLDGLDDDWTPWGPAPEREFTNLPYRHLEFHVEARDLTGRLSKAAVFAFAIAPPWWLSAWALAAYSLGTGGLVFAFVRWRTQILQTRAAGLETVVAERTGELAARNRELARLNRLEFDEKTAARLAEEKTRLEMLRYQLNPHFLYNALGSIRSLVHSRPDEADEMTSQLADFCRMTLTRRDDEAGTLGDELTMIKAYLDMERIRWRERLKVRIEAAPASLAVRLPPFLLLPLVENAIKHGMRTSEETVEIVITARVGATGMVIEVANTGRWIEPSGSRSPASAGIGLENLRQRLQRYFPGNHVLATVTDHGWVRVTLGLSTLTPGTSR